MVSDIAMYSRMDNDRRRAPEHLLAAGKPTEEEKAASRARREQVEALKRQPSDKLIAMRRREELLLEATPESRREADQIIRAVVRSGGLSAAESQALKSSY